MSNVKKKTLVTTEVSPDVLSELDALIKKIHAVVGDVPALTPIDVKRAAKLRKGGETVIPTVAALSDQFGLSIASHPTDAMVAKLKTAQSLIPLHKKMVAATKLVNDAIFVAESESFSSAQVHYVTLRRLSRGDGNVGKTLAPVKEFFAFRTPAAVQRADAKRGGKKGSKAAQAAKEQRAAEAHAPANAPAPTTSTETAPAAPVAPTTTTSTTAAPSPAPVSAAHS